MSSVFVEELKEKAKENLKNTKKSQSDRLEVYYSLLRWNNVFLALGSVCLGSVSFALMGYLLQTEISNSSFYFSTLLELLLGSIAIGIILWGIKSFITYSVWRGLLMRDGDRDIFYPFFTVEGMSDIAFLIFLPLVFIVTFIFGAYMGSLLLGASLLFKFFLMYTSYPEFLTKCTKADRIILIFTSIATLVVLNTIIKIFFI